MTPVIEGTAVELRRNWAVVLGGLVVVAMGLSMASELDGPLGWLVVWWGAAFTALVIARNAFRRGTVRGFRATSVGLELFERPPISVADIEGAKLLPRASSGDGELQIALRGGGRLMLVMPPSLGAAVLEVLGAAAGGRRTTFALTSAYRVRFLIAWTIVGLPWSVRAALEPTMTAALLPWLLVVVSIPSAMLAGLLGAVRGRLTIGADGFTTRWLRRERFVPFGEVAVLGTRRHLMERRVEDAIVTLRSTKRLRLRAREAPETRAARGAESASLVWHLDQALRRWRENRGVTNAGPYLARGPRTAAEWLRSLDALVSGGGAAYRVATLSQDALVEIVRSATDSPAEVRIGAAAALLRVGTDEHRVAVRIAADGCADPDVRAALLALSDARSEDATLAALDRVARVSSSDR